MAKFIKEHSLSLVITGFWLFFMLSSLVLWDGPFGEWLSDRAGGHADDAFGAFIIVVFAKWFVERGKNPSPESK